MASILGADVSLAVTGLFCGTAGIPMLWPEVWVLVPPHGLGTAAFANEKDAFPFAAIGMALTASACTVLVSLPWVKKSVLSLVIGV
ncbi:hypothetical protein ACHAWU_009899 [Discostella pseudostelligera]|uniref:Uncharacterized protein n=1 Tax=Discostella pseudostelligera TaxID=259834 RepID=A0ABD3LXN4_9STRA